MKACIIQRLRVTDDFPEKKFSEQCWTHNLAQLFAVAGLKGEFDATLSADPELLANWEVVRNWSEASRYAHTTRAKAEELYDAIADKKHGVLPWIKPHW